MEVLQTSPLGLLGTAPKQQSIANPAATCQSRWWRRHLAGDFSNFGETGKPPAGRRRYTT
jgi:hypothetical protein